MILSVLLVVLLPSAIQAQDSEFQAFSSEVKPETTGLPEFWTWSTGIGIGYGFPRKDYLRTPSGGTSIQADLRLRAGRKTHFHFIYRRQDLESNYSSWGGGTYLFDVTMDQYHLLMGVNGQTGFTKNSWTYFELGPVVQHYNSGGDWWKNTKLAVSLNLGTIIPMGDFLAADFGVSVLVHLTDPPSGYAWGTMGHIYAGLHFH